MKIQPVCSVIIPSYHSAQTISACLTALLNQDFTLPYEIILVDSSADETPELVRSNFPQVQLIHLSQRTGPAWARNIGAQQAQGEILAFIDADCVANSDWLRCLYETIQQGYDAAGGAITNSNGETLVSWAGYICEFREFLPGGAPRDVDNLTLGNAAYRGTAFWASGGFPIRWFPQEDQVIHHLLRRQGYRIRFDPQIIVAHTHRTDLLAYLDHQRHIGRVNARVVSQLGLPGATLTKYPWSTSLAMPVLVLWRFARTMGACWRVERALLLRRPSLAWLCWLGMCWWGQGFLEGMGVRGPWSIIYRRLSYIYSNR
jgi:glycosyltransferase involved in cell wall biosynthesis